MPDIDWGELARLADSEKFEPLPEQDFVFVVEKADAKNAASGKGLNISMKVKVVEGPEAGRSTYANLFCPAPGADVKPGAYSMAAARFAAIGVPLAMLAQHAPTPEQLGTLFVGRTFIGTVKHREWPKGSGEFRDGVDNIKPLPQGSVPGAGFTPGAAAAPTGGAPGFTPGATPGAAPAAPW